MNTATLLELAAVLRSLRVHYAEYVEMAKQQRAAVVHNDLEGLQDINLSIDRFVFAIEDLEKERIALMNMVCQDAGREITRLSELLEIHPSQESNLVVEEADQLREVLAQVRERNDVNQKIIKNSREFVRSTLAIVTGYVSPKPQNSFATYGRSGRIQVPRNQDVRLFTGSL